MKYFIYSLRDFFTNTKNLFYIGLLILLFMLLNLIVFIIIPFYWKKSFLKKYQLDFLPNKIKVTKQLKNTNVAYYTIEFPKWKKSKKDGTRDLRVTKNPIIYGKCNLYIGKYILITENPLILIDYVYYLRTLGLNISLNNYEKEKQKHIILQKKYQNTLYKIEELIEVFSSNPYAFEKYCASLYRKMGIQATTTSASNDGGYDIILKYPNKTTAIVECKCFNRNHSVGRPLIQKLVGANQVVHADNMIFITTSSFSEGAILYAEQCNVSLIDGITLIKMVQKYVKPDFKKIYTTLEECSLDKTDLREYIPNDILQFLEPK